MPRNLCNLACSFFSFYFVFINVNTIFQFPIVLRVKI